MIDESEVHMRRAVEVDPESAGSHANLAVVLQAQGRIKEAAAGYERALAIRGDLFDSYIGLGTCRLAQRDFAAAETQFRHAIAIDQRSPVAWAHAGMSIARQHRYDEALAAFARADACEETRPDEGGSFLNLAVLLAEQGRWQEALRLFERKLAAQPSVEANYAYAISLLTTGRLAEGWRQYEFRLLREPLFSRRPTFRKPVWNGQDVRGKSVLVRMEQGFGDFIQFVRFAPLIKALGAYVLLAVVPGLEKLASSTVGVDRIIDRDSLSVEFDYYINLLSLPRVFGTHLSSIAVDIPYLYADVASISKWTQKLDATEKLMVGLAWGGNPAHANDKYRSVSVSALAPFWSVAGVTLCIAAERSCGCGVGRAAGGSGLGECGPETGRISAIRRR